MAQYPARHQIQRLHEFITAKQVITSKEVMANFGISSSTAGSYLNQLAKTGAIECRGSGLKAAWYLLKPATLVRPTMNPIQQAPSIWHYARRLASC